jgi:hypothetical protein
LKETKQDRQMTASADHKQELLGLQRRWKTRRHGGEDSSQRTNASADGKQELLGLHRRGKTRPTNDRIGRRQTRTPWSAPQTENQTDKRPHRQTENKNSLVSTADGKPEEIREKI